MSETITVRWAGRDVEVQLAPSGYMPSELDGKLGEIELNASGHRAEWSACLALPGALVWDGPGVSIGVRSGGGSAQEALDGLAAQLRTMREWIARVERGGDYAEQLRELGKRQAEARAAVNALRETAYRLGCQETAFEDGASVTSEELERLRAEAEMAALAVLGKLLDVE